MLTRAEEDIAILESKEKNNLIMFEWAKGKEGDRNAERTENRQIAGERAEAEGAQAVPAAQNATV
jgi:hypothetical protein